MTAYCKFLTLAPTPPPPNKCPLNACSLQCSLELPLELPFELPLFLKIWETLFMMGTEIFQI